jgi:hypothetical protein
MKKFFTILGIVIIILFVFVAIWGDDISFFKGERQFITILAEPAVDEKGKVIPEESLFYVGYTEPWHRPRYITIENFNELDTADLIYIRSTTDKRLSFPKYKKSTAEEICRLLKQKRLIDHQY